MRRLMLLTPAALIAGLLAAPAVSEKRVQPTAHPATPTQSEQVVIRFRARERLDGVYRVEAKRRPAEPGCAAQRSRAVTAPRKGRVVRLKLLPPRVEGARQWCAGGYRATVLFKQTVRCKPPVQCGDSVEVPIGFTTFTVVPSRPPR